MLPSLSLGLASGCPAPPLTLAAGSLLGPANQVEITEMTALSPTADQAYVKGRLVATDLALEPGCLPLPLTSPSPLI